MTKSRIAVEPAKASELMAQGYEIECYLILPEPGATTSKKKSPTFVLNKNTVLGYSPEGKPPIKGRVAAAWGFLGPKFFKDPRNTATYGELRTALEKAGFDKAVNFMSQLVHAHKVLRVVK